MLARFESVGLLLLLLSTVAGCMARSSSAGPADQVLAEVSETEGTARAVAAATEYDFGILDSASECVHEFVVRNEGTVPLTIVPGGSSCFCTVSDVPLEPVPPSEEGAVRVITNLEGKKGFFSQVASVITNDPSQETIRFKVFGSIRATLGVWPEQIVFSGGDVGERQKAAITVYSQVWDDFSLEEPVASLEGVAWTITPATEEQLASVQAKSGYLVEVTSPDPAPAGNYWETLEFTAVAAQEHAPGAVSGGHRKVSVEITGAEPDRFTLSGPGYDPIIQFVRLGFIPQENGKTRILTLKFRDKHRNVAIRNISINSEKTSSQPINPDVLQVRVTPFNPGNPDLGLYRIDVEIPPGAPEANHMGVHRAEVSIETDHPHVPVVSFKVEFAVVRS